MSHALWFARWVVLLLFVTLALFAVLVWTRETSLGLQVQSGATPSALTTTPESADAKLLKAQLEQMQRTDERLLQTVYWAMATLAGIAVLLVGFSWFTNIRLTDKDRKQLRDELETALSTKVTEAESRLDDRLQELESKALELVSSELQKSEQEHQARFVQLQSDVVVTQFGLLETMARSGAALGNFNELLDTASTMIMIGKKGGVDFAVSRGLELMQSALSQGASPGVNLVAQINGVLEDLPTRFATDRNLVSDLLTRARQRMNTETEWEG